MLAVARRTHTGLASIVRPLSLLVHMQHMKLHVHTFLNYFSLCKINTKRRQFCRLKGSKFPNLSLVAIDLNKLFILIYYLTRAQAPLVNLIVKRKPTHIHGDQLLQSLLSLPRDF